ncbi:MAG: DUF523 domain-containing protein [Eubacteriales bacterium]|nr:DUF523 domain-containing protein [Eubacteriales bacterium]
MRRRCLLVSACLLGVRCRYDGKEKAHPAVLSLLEREDLTLIPVCPEQLGGLPTPRPAAECCGGRVVNRAGADVTEAYGRGAEQTLHLARAYHCDGAILKERSPSCGKGQIYDGSFSGVLTEGDGVAAALLLQHEIPVFGESELEQLEE